MPRSLVSSWKRVATSGPTADGREIKAQDLRDCADTYSTLKYTAVIWVDHERCHGAHGTVYAVRLVDNDPSFSRGQVGLEVQMKPNARLLKLNTEGEKLFTSVEITPNFANSGRAYMTGLAVTDEPASIGTQELHFSTKAVAATYRTAPVLLRAGVTSKLLRESLVKVRKELDKQVSKLKKRQGQSSKFKRVL